MIKSLWCLLFHRKYPNNEEWIDFSSVLRFCSKCGRIRDC